MTESMKYYEAIRREYPETISKDQFYRIAHISKATALHLLQSGLVPCRDSGKKTRRYTIRTDDVIYYMIDRELHPEVYRAPDLWYQGRSGHYSSRITYRNEMSKLSDDERAAFRKYVEHEFHEYSDLLTVVEVAEAIGYCDTSLHRWCNAKKLKAFNISGRFLIPKISLVDFLVSQYSFDITRKTWKHTLLIKSFLMPSSCAMRKGSRVPQRLTRSLPTFERCLALIAPPPFVGNHYNISNVRKYGLIPAELLLYSCVCRTSCSFLWRSNTHRSEPSLHLPELLRSVYHRRTYRLLR